MNKMNKMNKMKILKNKIFDILGKIPEQYFLIFIAILYFLLGFCFGKINIFNMSECLYCGQKNTKKSNDYCITYSCENHHKIDIESQKQYLNNRFINFDSNYQKELKYKNK